MEHYGYISGNKEPDVRRYPGGRWYVMHACTVILASSDHSSVIMYAQYLLKCVTPVVLLRNASVCLVPSIARTKDEPSSADQVPAGDEPGRQRAAVPAL